MILTILFLSAICLTLIACSKDNDKEAVNGDYITLKMNESSVVPNSNNTMKVLFKDIEDDRCLKSACYLCYGSYAHIQLSVINKGVTTDITLPMLGCVDKTDDSDNVYYPGYYIDTLGYRFRMVQLSPYPDGVPINKDGYIAIIKIKKL